MDVGRRWKSPVVSLTFCIQIFWLDRKKRYKGEIKKECKSKAEPKQGQFSLRLRRYIRLQEPGETAPDSFALLFSTTFRQRYPQRRLESCTKELNTGILCIETTMRLLFSSITVLQFSTINTPLLKCPRKYGFWNYVCLPVSSVYCLTAQIMDHLDTIYCKHSLSDYSKCPTEFGNLFS